MLLRLHGQPCLLPTGAPPTPLSLREAALLAWLHLEGPAPRSRLAGLLWPAGSEAQARANLRQTLARLRRGAGELVRDEAGLLTLWGVQVAEAGPGAGPLLGALVFDGLPEFARWLEARREDALRQQQREQLERGHAALAAGALDAALASADALLASQPDNEEAWRLRMSVLFQRGDRAAAIAAWDACKDQLRSSFGLAPSAATNTLGRLILASDTPPPTAGLAGTVLPVVLRRPPQLVGRAALLAAIERQLALGRSVVLSGPGGIGKSRLLQQAAAGRGAVLTLSARPGDEVLPGGLLARLLAAALAQFEPVLDAATRREVERCLPEPLPGALAAPPAGLRSELEHHRAMQAVARSLAACQARGLRLLVIDDLQFADAASLAQLQPLIGRWLAQAVDEEAGSPQVLLGARADELGAAGLALVGMVAGHAAGHRFEPAPLGLDDVAALVDDLPLPAPVTEAWGPGGRAALARALHATVGGNPAFVLEALRHLWLEGFAGWQPGTPLQLPATLVESVRRRVERLPGEALQLAQLAAVAQSDFDPALAAAALGRPTLALAPLFSVLEAAQVFHGQRFSHDLVAEAVRGLLPGALLAPLHRLVADHLVARAGPQARIAHHLLAAGDAGAATPWLLQAADSARARWQLAEAATAQAAAARQLQAEGQRAAAFEAWCGALRCWIELRRGDEAQAALLEARALAHGAQQQARLQAHAVHHLFNHRQVGEAVRAAAVLADALGAGGEQLDANALVYALRAVCVAVQGGLPADRVLALCEQLRPVIAAAGGEALAGFALARAATLLWDARPLAAAAELEPAWEALPADADPYLRRGIANQLMRVRQALGDAAGAVELAQGLLAGTRDDDADASFEADVLHLLAMLQTVLGEPAAALASIARLGERQRAAGEPVHEIYAIAAALCLTTLGRHADAAAWLDDHTQPPGRPGYATYDLVLLLARARLARARGEPPAPWVAQLAEVQPLPTGGRLLQQVALAALRPTPQNALAALLAELQGRGQHGLLRSAAQAAARAALAAGDTVAAAGHARTALALADRVNSWSDEPATVWLTGCEVLAACGADAEARSALQQGLAWVERGSAQCRQPADRAAWRHANPVHRALLLHAQALAADSGGQGSSRGSSR